jgi:hypothetical protein
MVTKNFVISVTNLMLTKLYIYLCVYILLSIVSNGCHNIRPVLFKAYIIQKSRDLFTSPAHQELFCVAALHPVPGAATVPRTGIRTPPEPQLSKEPAPEGDSTMGVSNWGPRLCAEGHNTVQKLDGRQDKSVSPSCRVLAK